MFVKFENDNCGIFEFGTNLFWSNGQKPLAEFLLIVFSQLNKSDVKFDTLFSLIFWFIHFEPL